MRSLDTHQAAISFVQVPEKQFLLLQVWTYAGMHDWAQLQHMAGKLDRRSPVATENFVAACR